MTYLYLPFYFFFFLLAAFGFGTAGHGVRISDLAQICSSDATPDATLPSYPGLGLVQRANSSVAGLAPSLGIELNDNDSTESCRWTTLGAIQFLLLIKICCVIQATAKTKKKKKRFHSRDKLFVNVCEDYLNLWFYTLLVVIFLTGV